MKQYFLFLITTRYKEVTIPNLEIPNPENLQRKHNPHCFSMFFPNLPLLVFSFSVSKPNPPSLFQSPPYLLFTDSLASLVTIIRHPLNPGVIKPNTTFSL